jgi:uncharacterized protein YneF (UPF0154 family)
MIAISFTIVGLIVFVVIGLAIAYRIAGDSFKSNKRKKR